MRTFCLIICVAIANECASQVVAVQNDNDKHFMLCIDNDITVAVEGLKSTSIVVTTDNGTIRKDYYRGLGHYVFHADRSGVANIIVKRKLGNIEKIIDTVRFYVRRMPLSTPRFAGKSKGELKQNIVLIQMGLIAPIECCGFDARFKIAGYTVQVFRNKEILFAREIKGAGIDSLTNDFFYGLKDNDVLRFTNIQIEDCDGELREAEFIEFTVTETHEYEYIDAEEQTVIEDPFTGETKKIRRRIGWQEK